MKIIGPLIKGNFIDRPNRFVTIVKVGNKTVKSHLPDPGRYEKYLHQGENYIYEKQLHANIG